MHITSSSAEFMTLLEDLARQVRDALSQARFAQREMEDDIMAAEDNGDTVAVDELRLVHDDFTTFIKGLRKAVEMYDSK
ncbi:MAG: hypothetical protein WC444_04900 [Candidatus Paceibacterota bacterium]